jgi:hypothetical protein
MKEKCMLFSHTGTYRMMTMTVAAALSLCAFSTIPANAQSGTGKGKNAPKPGTGKPKPIPGGANQVSGLNGKLGDMLWDGRWRFQVQEVKEVSSYVLTVPSSQQDYGRTRNYAREDPTTHAYIPQPGYTLIAVKCLAKNGQNSIQQLDCYPPDLKTALTDDQGNSYPPFIYDMQTDGAWTTKKLLPGSSATMTILFAVPPGTKLKDLVFSLKNWSGPKVNNLRIALPAGAAPPQAPAEPAPL